MIWTFATEWCNLCSLQVFHLYIVLGVQNLLRIWFYAAGLHHSNDSDCVRHYRLHVLPAKCRRLSMVSLSRVDGEKIVLSCHIFPNSPRALSSKKTLPEIRVWGPICRSVGNTIHAKYSTRSSFVTLLSRLAQSGRWSSFGKWVWFTESHLVLIISFLLVLFTQFILDIK